MPPHRYLTERRIALAKDLIARREFSLTEIALSTGFGSSSHFSVAFRNAVGVSLLIRGSGTCRLAEAVGGTWAAVTGLTRSRSSRF